MKRLVADASVVVKVFFDEENSAVARRLLLGAEEAMAPDWIWVEAANVVWKKQRRGEIPPEDAVAILKDMAALPVRTVPSKDLIDEAMVLAMELGRSVYDSLYVALAVRTGAPMVTADERLANAVAGTPLERSVLWIGGDGV